jgi:hypothetical protein
MSHMGETAERGPRSMKNIFKLIVGTPKRFRLSKRDSRHSTAQRLVPSPFKSVPSMCRETAYNCNFYRRVAVSSLSDLVLEVHTMALPSSIANSPDAQPGQPEGSGRPSAEKGSFFTLLVLRSSPAYPDDSRHHPGLSASSCHRAGEARNGARIHRQQDCSCCYNCCH